MKLSFHFGVLFTAFVAYLVILRGMEGILSANSFIVPLMLLFTILVGITGWQSGEIQGIIHIEYSPRAKKLARIGDHLCCF